MKFDKSPDTVASSMSAAIGCVINWQNESYRRFGLWKRWPLHNIQFQKLRMQAGEITESQFNELREMFMQASRENA